MASDDFFAKRYNITIVPSLLLFENGVEVATFKHRHLAVSLASFVTSHLLGLQHKLKEKAPLVRKLRHLQQKRATIVEGQQEATNKAPSKLDAHADAGSGSCSAEASETSSCGETDAAHHMDAETLDQHIEDVKAKIRLTNDPIREPEKSMIVTLTDESFDHHTWTHPVTMIEFYAPV